jgi:transcriptional activator of cad operon
VTYQTTPSRFAVGTWSVDADTGEIFDGQTRERLEPKTMDLLRLLAARPDQVVSREQIMAALWPDVIVADDALARTLFKLRRALGDDAKSSRYIETLPKRGYRLTASVRGDSAAIEVSDRIQAHPADGIVPAATGTKQSGRRGRLLASSLLAAMLITAGLLMLMRVRNTSPAAADPDRALIERADDFYYQYSRADNEAAIELYERILVSEPDRTEALRGLANALTQRMIRWPQDPKNGTEEFKTLTASLENGHLRAPSARRSLERAELLARRAIAVDPEDSLSHRALGLALSTQSHFSQAIAEYRTAIALDPDAWGAMINLSEALELTGKRDESLAALVDAHAAMTRRYSRDKQHIMPYYADLAVLIGDRLTRTDRAAEAEAWFRRALMHAPLHPAATVALAERLVASGRRAEAESLCNELNARISVQPACAALLAAGSNVKVHE